MNLIAQAQQAYAPQQMPLRSPRSIEAELISKITARLKQASASPQNTYPQLISALHDNRRMWATMATDVADSMNQLPSELRAQVFYLAEFTELHSRKVMNGEAQADVLVEINTAILRGLNNTGAR